MWLISLWLWCPLFLTMQEGISCELIDLRTLIPWDRETVEASVNKTGQSLVSAVTLSAKLSFIECFLERSIAWIDIRITRRTQWCPLPVHLCVDYCPLDLWFYFRLNSIPFKMLFCLWLLADKAWGTSDCWIWCWNVCFNSRALFFACKSL